MCGREAVDREGKGWTVVDRKGVEQDSSRQRRGGAGGGGSAVPTRT